MYLTQWGDSMMTRSRVQLPRAQLRLMVSPCTLLVLFTVAILAVRLAPVVSAASSRDQTKTEPNDDGKPHFVYSVDGEGRKNGEYRELSPEGHVLVAATYLKGQLNGP